MDNCVQHALATMAVVQPFATLLLGMAGVALATVGAIFTYQNNFGWPPIVFILLSGRGSQTPGGAWVSAEFEIWNRRKYSILVRRVRVDFGMDRIVRVDDALIKPQFRDDRFAWLVQNGEMDCEPNAVIEVGKQLRVEAVGLYSDPVAVDAHDVPPVSVKVWAFDPRLNKHMILMADSYRYARDVRRMERRWR